jgi:hypothetical protein
MTTAAQSSSLSKPDDWPLWLTRRETADYLWQAHGQKFGVAALANAAVKEAGAGPPFHKQGGVRVSYWRPDVDAWATTRRRRALSTSELRKAGGTAEQAA